MKSDIGHFVGMLDVRQDNTGNVCRIEHETYENPIFSTKFYPSEESMLSEPFQRDVRISMVVGVLKKLLLKEIKLED